MQLIDLRKIQRLLLRGERSYLEDLIFSFRGIFLFTFFLSALVNLILIVPALYMFQIYDSVLTSRSFETLIGITIIVLFFYLLYGFLNWARSRILVEVSHRMDQRLSPRLFPIMIESVIRTGSTAGAQAYSDVANVRQFFTGAPIFAIFDAPFGIIYLAIIFIIHPVLGVFSLVTGLIAFVLAVISERESKTGIEEANKYFQKAHTFLITNLRNAEVIEAMGMHRNIFKKWFVLHTSMLDYQFRASSKAGIYDAIIKFVRISSQSLILGLGAYYVIKGTLTPGLMIMASILMGRALAPIDLVIGSWRQWVSFRQSYMRLKELLVQYPPQPKRLPLPIPKGNLVVENLFVIPPGGKREVVRGVSFTVNPGELLVIVGPSASGKSSLAKTLVGVWKPVIGSIKLDGADLSLYNKEHLGSYIGYLPQDIELFSGTIAENIARYGEVNMQLVVKSAILAGIHEMILGLPEGYETEIGEGGVFLSGGQRQRIALARAMYGDPILIVLDEPNSNLDEDGHRALIDALLYLKKQGKTIIVISHHTNILSISDKMLFLKDGQVVQYGRTKDVLEVLYSRGKAISQ